MRVTVYGLLLALFPAAAGWAATYHVSTNGDDANDGSRWGTAFASIQRGIESLEPGDTLIVGPGVYHEEVAVEKSGTKEKPITIRALFAGLSELVGSKRLSDWTPVSGRRQVFRSRLTTPTYLVYEKDTGVGYTEVANLHMLEQTPGAFLYDADEDAIYVHPSDNAGMDHHVVDACVLDYGFVSKTTDPPWAHTPRRVGLRIEGFVIRDFDKGGIWIHNADYCSVRNCVVHHCRRGIFTASAYRSQIVDCEAFACADRFNREMGNIGMLGYSFECLLARNVVHSTRQHGIRFYSGFYGCEMRDNLAYDCQIGVHVKGSFHDHAQASRYARFSNGGAPNLDPNREMRFIGNVAHGVRGSAGLLPSYCRFENNIGVKTGAVRSPDKARNNVNLESEPTDTDGFAATEWHDFRPVDEVVIAPADAVLESKSGQTIYLKAGKRSAPLKLANLQNVTIRARRKGSVTLPAIEIADCRKIRVEGLRIAGSEGGGVTIDSSEAVRFSENEIIDHASNGVRIAGRCAGVEISRNTIAFNRGAGLSIGSGESEFRILGNLIRQNDGGVVLAADFAGKPICVANNLDRELPRNCWSWSNVDLAAGFVDTEARDLRLTRVSLNRGRGWLGRPIGAGRLVPAASSELRFEDLRVVHLTPNTADLAWNVSGGKTTEIIAFGTDPDALETTIVRDTGHYFGCRHLRTLTGLQPGARYYVRVGSRRLPEAERPYHAYRYAWPERTPAGEADFYATIKKEDRLDRQLPSFTTPERYSVEGRTFHISPTGDDDNPGTESKPWQTLAHASDHAAPGDRVVVHEGVYRDIIRPIRSGLPQHPIVFEAAPGARVEINGARELIPHGVDLHNRRHVVIRGFIFHGQTEKAIDDSGYGQIRIVECEDIRIEHCLFDGRMNYINPVMIYRSRDVTVHNNIFVSHHLGLIAHDNLGTIEISRNSFLGPTINKIYAPRNDLLVIRNNLFGENLFPKKQLQFKVVVALNREVEMDYNCFQFEPENKERRAIDLGLVDPALVAASSFAEQQASGKIPVRHKIKGTLDQWREELGYGQHSFIADPMWAEPDAVAAVRARFRGWPNRFTEYPPLIRQHFRLAENSPCHGAGTGGVDIGADCDW